MRETNQFLYFIQEFIKDFQKIADWLITPIENDLVAGLLDIFGIQPTPLFFLLSGGITIIFVLHLAHLANVITG